MTAERESRPLAGRIAIVTGGGWNVGRGVAEAFAAAGAHVVVAARQASRLDETVAAIRAAGGSASARVTDVTVAADAAGLVGETLDSHGRLDVLACIAGGLNPYRPIDEIDAEDWARVFAVNVHGTFHCLRPALPHFRAANAGTVITCSGGGGFWPVLGEHLAPYAAAKAALCRLTDQLTAELWETDVRVHAMDPGVVWDPPTRARIEAEEAESGQRHPHRDRVRSPADAGALAVWLASDASKPLRGRCISVEDAWWRDPEHVAAVHATIHAYRLRRADP